MRTITVCAGLVIIVCCAQPVFAQDAPQNALAKAYAFSIEPQFGFFYGRAEEIVYPSSPMFVAPLLSQLLWDIQPVVYYGLALDFAQTQPLSRWGFFVSLSLKNGIPGKSGYMEDRDWQSIENDALTHYSISDNITKTLFLLDTSAGLSFPVNRTVLLRTYVNVSYMYLDFSGENGHGIYARLRNFWDPNRYYPIDDNPSQADFSGRKVIAYTQQWFHIAPGISLRFYFLERFYTEWSFAFSPVVFCNDEDQHLLTDAQYLDFMRGGVLIEPGFRFSLTANRWLEFSLDCSWRYIRGTRGETYSRKPIGTGYYSQNGEAGAGLSIADAGLSVKIRF